MLRFKLALLAASLTAGAVGCTQCDTCDDFPTPCVGGNCGPQQVPPHAAAGAYSMVTPGPQPVPTMLPPGAPMPPSSAASAVPAPSADVPPPPAANTNTAPASIIPAPPSGPADVTPPAPDRAGEMPNPLP